MNIPQLLLNTKLIFKCAQRITLLLCLLLPLKGTSQVQTLGIPFQGVAKDYAGNFVNQSRANSKAQRIRKHHDTESCRG